MLDANTKEFQEFLEEILEDELELEDFAPVQNNKIKPSEKFKKFIENTKKLELLKTVIDIRSKNAKELIQQVMQIQGREEIDYKEGKVIFKNRPEYDQQKVDVKMIKKQFPSVAKACTKQVHMSPALVMDWTEEE